MNVNFEAIEKAWFKSKKTDLIKDYELTCYKNYELKQENEKLKTFIDEIIKTLKHCKLNGTNKLDIVAEFIEKEYDEQINGVINNE